MDLANKLMIPRVFCLPSGVPRSVVHTISRTQAYQSTSNRILS